MAMGNWSAFKHSISYSIKSQLRWGDTNDNVFRSNCWLVGIYWVTKTSFPQTPLLSAAHTGRYPPLIYPHPHCLAYPASLKSQLDVPFSRRLQSLPPTDATIWVLSLWCTPVIRNAFLKSCLHWLAIHASKLIPSTTLTFSRYSVDWISEWMNDLFIYTVALQRPWLSHFPIAPSVPSPVLSPRWTHNNYVTWLKTVFIRKVLASMLLLIMLWHPTARARSRAQWPRYSEREDKARQGQSSGSPTVQHCWGGLLHSTTVLVF